MPNVVERNAIMRKFGKGQFMCFQNLARNVFMKDAHQKKYENTVSIQTSIMCDYSIKYKKSSNTKQTFFLNVPFIQCTLKW